MLQRSPHKQDEKKSHWVAQSSASPIPDKGLICWLHAQAVPKGKTQMANNHITAHSPLLIKRVKKDRTKLRDQVTQIQPENHDIPSTYKTGGNGYSGTIKKKKISKSVLYLEEQFHNANQSWGWTNTTQQFSFYVTYFFKCTAKINK